MWSQKRTAMNPIRKRWLSLHGNALALVTAFLAFCSVTLMAQRSATASGQGNSNNEDQPKRFFPNTTNGIFAYSDQIDTGSLTEAQFQFAATHYVGTQKVTTAAARHFRKYNRNFLVMHYRLGEELGYGVCDQNGNPTATDPLQIIDRVFVEEWPGDSVVQPQWFYPYAGSPRVYDCGEQHYLMNLDDPSWRAWYSKLVIKELKDNEDDAVFADSFSVPNYLGATNWTPNLPLYDPTFEAAWAQSIHRFTDYMRARFQGRWLWIPNVGSWVTTRDPTDYTNVDGAMIEDFADYGNENFLAPSDWVLQMNRALSLINLNKILIGQAYPAPWTNNTAAINERLFILGSYLLVKGTAHVPESRCPGWSVEWTHIAMVAGVSD